MNIEGARLEYNMNPTAKFQSNKYVVPSGVGSSQTSDPLVTCIYFVIDPTLLFGTLATSSGASIDTLRVPQQET